MADTIIPAGYRLTVTSWENDADAYNTLVAEGLSKERAQFLIEAVELCRSNKLGNMYEPTADKLSEFEQEALKLYQRFPNQYQGDNPEDIKDSRIAADCLHEELYDLMGSSEHFYTRVTESWKIEYVPQSIVLVDARAEFRKPGKNF